MVFLASERPHRSFGQPAISVIIPAYNAENYVLETLSSVLGQTLEALEVIVVDDASTDRTAAIVAELARRDPRLRLISQCRNSGVCHARNAGIAAAEAPWIAFIDSDDVVAPERLAAMLAAAETLGVDWVADDQMVVEDPGGKPLGRVFRHEADGARIIEVTHLIERDPPERIGYGTLKPLVRRSFLIDQQIGFRVGLERFEDFVFHVECGTRAARMALLNRPFYCYRRRPGSLTSIEPIATLTGMLRQNAATQAIAQRWRANLVDGALARREKRIRAALNYRTLLGHLCRRELGLAVKTLGSKPASSAHLLVGLASAARRRLLS